MWWVEESECTLNNAIKAFNIKWIRNDYEILLDVTREINRPFYRNSTGRLQTIVPILFVESLVLMSNGGFRLPSCSLRLTFTSPILCTLLYLLFVNSFISSTKRTFPGTHANITRPLASRMSIDILYAIYRRVGPPLVVFNSLYNYIVFTTGVRR